MKSGANFSLIKKVIQQEIESLEKTMVMLEFKCWYYDKALQDGNEDELRQMLPDNLPEEIQKSMTRPMSNAGYGQIGDFLRFARKFSHPLRAKRHFLRFARKIQSPVTGKSSFLKYALKNHLLPSAELAAIFSA